MTKQRTAHVPSCSGQKSGCFALACCAVAAICGGLLIAPVAHGDNPASAAAIQPASVKPASAVQTAPPNLANLLPPSATESAQQKFARRLLLQPTLVSVHLKAAAPEAVGRAICSQVGLKYKFEAFDFGPKAAPINFDVEKAPLLSAMRQFLMQTHTALNPSDKLIDVSSMGDLNFSGPVYQKGRFMFVGDSADDHAQVDFTGVAAKQSHYLSLTIDVVSEPNLKDVIIGHSSILKTAVDNRGNNLALPPSDSHYHGRPSIYSSAYWDHSMEFYLHRPARLGSRISMLTGLISAGVRTASRNIKITNIMAPQIRTIKVLGNKLLLKPMVAEANGYKMRVQVIPPGVDPLHINDTATQKIITAIELVFIRPLPVVTDAPGRAYVTEWDPDCGCQHDGKGTLTFSYPRANTPTMPAAAPTITGSYIGPPAKVPRIKLGVPTSFFWRSPSRFATIRIPFTLKNLKLPQ